MATGKESTARGRVLKSEANAAQFIPYTTHVDPWTVKTRDGDFVQVIKIEGIAHETSDIAQINAWYEGRNNLYRNLSNSRRAIWTTIIRHEENKYPQGDFEDGFAETLNGKYREKITNERMYVNDMYIAVMHRNISDIPLFGGLAKALSKTNRFQERKRELEAIKTLSDTALTIERSFGAYNATRLRTYENGGFIYSSVLEYLAHIINGVYQRIPLVRRDASEVICNTRISFGSEAFEIRGVHNTLVGASLGIKEYCAETGPGMLDGLLELPFGFVLTQSFTFINKPSAIRMMQIQRDRMVNAGDLAESQIAEIEEALDDLVSNRFVMGDHHLTFTVHGETVKGAQDQLAQASTTFGEMGFVTAREDLALEAGYWAQLPGNHGYRPRKAPITSRNFAGLMSFHNYPTGRIAGNWWGPAMSVFKTTSNTPYYFNFHLTGETPLGNATVIGPSGTGKTVFMGFTMAQSEKYQPKVVFFDKDRGAEIFIRAQRGQYSTIAGGIQTGFNPLRMQPTPANLSFWAQWIKILATSRGEPYSVADSEEVNHALKGLLGLPVEQRRLSTLHPFLDATKAEGVSRRLAQWVGEGEFAWAFDNVDDSLSLDARLLGFDITELLDNPTIRTPMLFYLFHRIDELIDGQKIMIYIDEGWKAVDDPVFEPRIRDWLKTIRKRNGLLVFGTQSAKDAAECRIGDAIIEQSAVNVFMPNDKATYEHYVEKFALSETEFNVVRSLPAKSRQFLIRQEGKSVVVEMSLGGMDDEIPVLSGSEANVNLLDQIRAEVGDDPEVWMPIFHQRRLQS